MPEKEDCKIIKKYVRNRRGCCFHKWIDIGWENPIFYGRINHLATNPWGRVVSYCPKCKKFRKLDVNIMAIKTNEEIFNFDEQTEEVKKKLSVLLKRVRVE